MNSTFLSSLRDQQPIFDAILDVCQPKTMPVFIDLCWGDGFDTLSAFEDPGIQLDSQERRLVLMRVNDEIRYYVGPKAPSVSDSPQEIGSCQAKRMRSLSRMNILLSAFRFQRSG